MSLKPCIHCGKECDIMPMQLGDSFTLCYLRVCGPECLFSIAYDYLHEVGYHKQFRSSLYDKQNPEDKEKRDEWVKEVTEGALKAQREYLESNPHLLSTPAPESILKMFRNSSKVPLFEGKTMTFTRPSLENKIKWQKAYVEKLTNNLKEALLDLEKLENG